MAALQGIYAIVNEGEGDPLSLARAYVNGGIRILQYRAKHGVDEERLRALRELTRASGAALIMNDDWCIALAFACDGVHLGPGDDGFDDPARVRVAAPHLIIGLSCGTEIEARAASAGAVDYIGVGPVFATGSKSDAGEPIGIAGLRRVASATTLPVAAIGGISLDEIDAVRMSGVAMAAVISALSKADDPLDAARMFVARWRRGG
jgi:thiamine-phosphate pyrophosphorylase